jgi:hypothetical protein
MKTHVLAFTLMVSLSVYAAEDYDFVLIANKCEMLVSATRLDDKALQHHEADRSVQFCIRNSRQVKCEISHPEREEKIYKSTYTVHLDSPPYLMFSTENGSEMTLVNSNNNAATYMSRIISGEVLGSKVCNMTFFTKDQYELLSEEGD